MPLMMAVTSTTHKWNILTRSSFLISRVLELLERLLRDVMRSEKVPAAEAASPVSEDPAEPVNSGMPPPDRGPVRTSVV